MIQPHDSRKIQALGFNNLGTEILEIKEEDTTLAEPDERIRKRLQEKYGQPKPPSGTSAETENK